MCTVHLFILCKIPTPLHEIELNVNHHKKDSVPFNNGLNQLDFKEYHNLEINKNIT